MDLERVRGYFNEEGAVQHYAKAVANVGLWESEEKLARRHFRLEDELLDLGCGAGRVSIGLWELGFLNVRGADLAESMVAEANRIADCLGCPIRFERQDATGLDFPDGSFDGVIFAFNGLMQIPGRKNRRAALREIHRILRVGGRFLFSTLDREDRLYSKVFADRDDFDHDLTRNRNLVEYGDRHFATEHGTTFMHVPLSSEVMEDLEQTGFELLEEASRSSLARESHQVLSFSEDCRLWVARRGASCSRSDL